MQNRRFQGVNLSRGVHPDKAWSEKEQFWKASGIITRTSNVTQTARGQKGLWTTTIAIAMLLLD